MDKNKIKKMWYDEETDILYLSLGKGEAVDSEEIEDNIRVEYDREGKITGIEISEISRYLAKSIAERLKKVAVG